MKPGKSPCGFMEYLLAQGQVLYTSYNTPVKIYFHLENHKLVS
jgi:hypothetical protein